MKHLHQFLCKCYILVASKQDPILLDSIFGQTDRMSDLSVHPMFCLTKYTKLFSTSCVENTAVNISLGKDSLLGLQQESIIMTTFEAQLTWKVVRRKQWTILNSLIKIRPIIPSHASLGALQTGHPSKHRHALHLHLRPQLRTSIGPNIP